MAFLIIKNLANTSIEISQQISILKNLHENFIDIRHACGGKGRCVSCKMQILEGENMLSIPTEAENNFKNLQLLKENERLACQTYANSLANSPAGDFEEATLIISIPKETQLAHLEYLF